MISERGEAGCGAEARSQEHGFRSKDRGTRFVTVSYLLLFLYPAESARRQSA